MFASQRINCICTLMALLFLWAGLFSRLMVRLCVHCACSMAPSSHSTSIWHRAMLWFATVPRRKLPKLRSPCTCMSINASECTFRSFSYCSCTGFIFFPHAGACSGTPPSWQNLLGKRKWTASLHRASRSAEQPPGRPLQAPITQGWVGQGLEPLIPSVTHPTGTTTTAAAAVAVA